MVASPRKACSIFLLALCLAVISIPQAAYGQVVYGSIFGTVTDTSGAGVPNAKVTISDINKGTQSEVTTNETGNFTKSQLVAGDYTISVESSGFKKAVAKDVVVSTDAAARVDFALQVGNVSESVEVTAEAPLLQSDRAEVNTQFTSKQLIELPSFDRNFQAYQLLTPGAQRLGWQHASSENPQGSVQIQVNGQHFSGTDFQLDGTSNQDPILGIIVINPAIDSIVESKIASQNFDAEYALAAAGVVNVSTRSGTNEIHGSAFEYLRDNTPGFTTFARNPFNDAEGKNGVPPVKWNQFGGSVGGAIIKNKLFYFGDAQLTRRRTGSSVLTSVPTALARTGNFSEYLLNSGGTAQNVIYDPATGNPVTGVGRTAFPNNTIPANRLSPQALNILKFLPLPNAPGNAGATFRNNYAATGSESFDSNQFDVRGDYFVNEKSQVFGRYSSAAFNKFAPGAFGILPGGPALDNINFAGTSDVKNQSLALGYNRTLSPTLITEVRFGYMRYRVTVAPNGLGTQPAADAGIPGLNLDKFFTSGMPYFSIGGDGGTNIGYSLGANQCNCPLAEREQQYQVSNNTTKIYGNHSFKFGADIREALNLRVPSDNHRAGELTFSGNNTGFIQNAGSNANGGTGLGIATFLLGDVTHFQRYVSPTTDASEHQKRWFFYGQDTWRLTPKLTLNYGVRWELIFPEKVNKAGNGGQLDLRTGEINVFGVGQVSDHGIQDMNWKNLAPRLGVTYQLTSKTVLRAGYGWSYALGTFGTIFGHNVTQNLPVLANQILQNPNGDYNTVFTLAQGPTAPVFPTPDSSGRFKLPDGIGGKARPLDVRLPRSEAYNVTVQQQIGSAAAVEIGYVGNVGRHVFMGDGPNFDVNSPAAIPGLSDAQRRPFYSKFGWTQGIDFYCDCANSRYDSMQASIKTRNMKGVTAILNFTLERAQGDSGDSYTFLYNRPLGYGNKDGISTFQFTAPVTADIPFGRGRKYGSNLSKPVDYALGGWTVSSVTAYYSGRPFTPNIGTTPSGAIRPNAGPGGRPNQLKGDPYSGASGDRNQFFAGCSTTSLLAGTCAAFGLPADNAFGNYPINTLHGPIFIQEDLSLAKNFALTERFRLQVRAEAFNAFNHTNLGDPNNDITSTDAGKITGLAPGALMRRMQFGFRLDF